MASLTMPLLGYGTWPLTGDEATACTLMALELGYRHLDTAQMYRNEAEVGRAMRESGLPRDEIFLTTKVHPDNYGETAFAPSVSRSLEALGFDQVDLLLLHWPHARHGMEAVLERLMATQEEGQARTIGVSNFHPDDLARAQAITGGRLACNQIEIHPLVNQRPSIKASADAGLRLTAYCPVARGQVMDDPTLREIGESHGVTAAQIALAWLVQQDIAAIPMSRNRERAKANLESRAITLSDEQMQHIDGIAGPKGRLIDSPGLAATWA